MNSSAISLARLVKLVSRSGAPSDPEKAEVYTGLASVWWTVDVRLASSGRMRL